MSQPEAPSEYWRLDHSTFDHLVTASLVSAFLTRHNYFHHPSARRTRLVKLAIRRERGLISYEDCSVFELHGFVFSRGLLNGFPGYLDSEQAVAILEDADDDASFLRFTDLPRKLQLRIFALYLSSLGPLPVRPRIPPLAFASKSTYEMVRPLFYTCCTFTILAIQLRSWAEQDELRHYSRTLTTWLPKLIDYDEELLASMRRLAIHVYRWAPVLEFERDPDREQCENCWEAEPDEDLWRGDADPECEYCYERYTSLVDGKAPHAQWMIDLGSLGASVELRRSECVDYEYHLVQEGVTRRNWCHYEDDMWLGADWQENHVMASLEKAQADVVSRRADGDYEPRRDVQELCWAAKRGYLPRVQ
nr:hypothetical protein B0A51_13905 [Rachicladosporium sp. CCFEE 5018]